MAINLRHRRDDSLTYMTLEEQTRKIRLNENLKTCLDNRRSRIDVHLLKCGCDSRKDGYPIVNFANPALEEGKVLQEAILKCDSISKKEKENLIEHIRSRGCVLKETDCANGFLLFSCKEESATHLLEEIAEFWKAVDPRDAKSDLANTMCMVPMKAIRAAVPKLKHYEDLVEKRDKGKYRIYDLKKIDKDITNAKKEADSVVCEMFSEKFGPSYFSNHSRNLSIFPNQIGKPYKAKAKLNSQVVNCHEEFKEMDENLYCLFLGWEKVGDDDEVYIDFGIPGGKRFIHEDSWECAVRECKEETGFTMAEKEMHLSSSMLLKVNPETINPWSMKVFIVNVDEDESEELKTEEPKSEDLLDSTSSLVNKMDEMYVEKDNVGTEKKK